MKTYAETSTLLIYFYECLGTRHLNIWYFIVSCSEKRWQQTAEVVFGNLCFYMKVELGCLPLKISLKSVGNFFSFLAKRQTNKQTGYHITALSGGNERSDNWARECRILLTSRRWKLCCKRHLIVHIALMLLDSTCDFLITKPCLPTVRLSS